MTRMMLNIENNERETENMQAVAETVNQEVQETVVVRRRGNRREEAAEPATEDRYAHMFAEWDLLPPQVLIRRINRKI